MTPLDWGQWALLVVALALCAVIAWWWDERR
jgi:hypothetical protein